MLINKPFHTASCRPTSCFFCDCMLLPRDCRFCFIAWNTVSMHPAFLAEVHSAWAAAKRARLDWFLFIFEYRFTNCSYHEHGAGHISNPSKFDDIIHYFHFFLTFDGDNIKTRDFLFLSSVTASYIIILVRGRSPCGATCTAKQERIVQTQNFVFGRFSNFFFIRMRPGPTHPLPFFWGFLAFV